MSLSDLHPTSKGYLLRRFHRALASCNLALSVLEEGEWGRDVTEARVTDALSSARQVLTEHSNNDQIEEVAAISGQLLGICNYLVGRSLGPELTATRASRRGPWEEVRPRCIEALSTTIAALEAGMEDLR